MGGLAGVIVRWQKVRAVLDYGLIAMGFVGIVYLAVLQHHRHAYFLLVLGLVCLVGGIVGGTGAQRRALTIRR